VFTFSSRLQTNTPVMADFLAVVGIALFVGLMLGLIWALERV
jgi:hypothetical protein